MTYKDKIDYVLRFIAIMVSWPVVFLCAVFLVRKQLPLLITNLAERMTKAPGGLEFIALKERVEEITERVKVLETTRFEPSNALTTALQTYLQSSFDVFQNYLIDIGYSPSEREVKILVDPEMRDNVYYDNENHRIVLGAPLANDSDAFFREYTHHALMIGMNPWELNNDQASLESALADYFLVVLTMIRFLVKRAFTVSRKFQGTTTRNLLEILITTESLAKPLPTASIITWGRFGEAPSGRSAKG